jgi:ABC-type multidrug transport system ATPase subunit
MESIPSKLSGGQQRILTILSNVLSRPGASLYIIDEPLNNLDSKNIPTVVNFIRQLHLNFPRSSFLIVTHNDLFDFIDKVIEL